MSENIPDPMDAEQTWPTAEELAEAEDNMNAKKHRVKKIPKGMSDYQAAWIPDDDAGKLVDLDFASKWSVISNCHSHVLNHSQE